MKKLFMTLMSTALLAWAVNGHAIEAMGVDIHGFLSQGYLSSSDNNFHAPTSEGTFEFNEFGVNFSADLTDDLRVGLQLISRDLGTSGNNDVVLDWAYGDYHWKDWLGFRVGLLKAPHGLYNETRDVDMLRPWIFLPQSVYPEVVRDATLSLQGIGVYGYFDLKAAGGLSYQAMMGTQNLEPSEKTLQSLMGMTGKTSTIANDSIDVDSKYAFALLWDTPLEGLRVGGTLDDTDLTFYSHFTKNTPRFDAGDPIIGNIKQVQSIVYSIEYTWGDLMIVGEYIRTKRDIMYIRWQSMRNVESDGWYLGASYVFADWFQLGGYYSETYGDVDDRDGIHEDPAFKAWLKDTCLTARFDINAYCSFKLEGHRFDGVQGLAGFDNLEGNWEEDWTLIAAKVTFSF